jgi:hypothetical protein
MAVTTIAKPGDFSTTFSLMNIATTQDMIQYGITANGKIYRGRIRHDAGVGSSPGGPGTWVDTGLTIPDVSIVGDL